MIDLAAIRAELHTALRSINGGELNIYSLPVAQPEYPCVMFKWPERLEYHTAFSNKVGAFLTRFDVMVMSADLEAAITRLDEYANPHGNRSIRNTLETYAPHPAWSSLTVIAAANWRELTEIDGLACEMEVQVFA